MTALLLDPVFKEHVPGPGHPECPERYDAVTAALSGLDELPRIPVRDATTDEIALCHSRRYITVAEREIRDGLEELSTGDTHVSPRSYDVAVRAVGSVLNAVDAVMERKYSNAFCAVRPPGHHATPGRGMGFCVFNNVADCGAIRAAAIRRRAGDDCRLGCPSRQRHAGHFLRGRQRVLLQHAPVAVVSRHGSAQWSAAKARARARL